MINFPASPIINQILSYNGLSWRFDGTSWVSLHPSGFQGAFFRHKVILQEESNHFEIGIPSFNVATDQIFVYAGGIYQNIPQEIVVTATTIEKVTGTWPAEADFDILVIKQDESSTGGSSVNYFTDIFDVPKSYTGMAGKAVVVKATEDGLEFGNVASNESGEPTSYVRAALDLTETMANASGFYTTTTENPDGSMTVYYHNNPLLSYSTIVYMRSAEGFVWTDNYQGSLTVWNAGYTANGNMVIKTLSALGINADWINAGKINAAHISIGSNTTFADGYNPATAIANAQAAQKAAEIAQSEALSATQEANSAAWNAQLALDELAQISADNMITASEKQALKKEWDVIVSEKPVIDAQAVEFSIVTEKATYGTKYNALDVYLNQDFTIFGDLTVTSQIFSGEDLRLVFTEYYDARTALLNTIAMAAKTVADTAQSAVTTLQNSLGNLAYTDMVEKALLGSTIISGGYIKSDLLTADNIVTGQIAAARVRIGAGTTFDTGYDPTTKLAADEVGDLAYLDLVESAKLGTTIISGGYIKSDLLTADNIVTGQIAAARVRIGAGTTFDSGYDPSAKLDEADVGDLAFLDLVESAKLGTTIISGGYIKSDLLTADNIVTGSLTSSNYAYTTGSFSDVGTKFDLTNGSIISKNFAINTFGNAKFYSGTIGGFSLSPTVLSGGDLKLNVNGSISVSPEYSLWSFAVDSVGKLTATGPTFSKVSGCSFNSSETTKFDTLGNLTVGGTSSFKGNMSCTGTLTVESTFKVGDFTDYCTISSLGAINTTNSLTVKGNTTLNGFTNTIANGLKHTGTTLGFFNATPAVKTTVLAPSAITTTGTADAIYSSNEQTMLGNLKTDVTNLRSKLNEIWDALDGYGLI